MRKWRYVGTGKSKKVGGVGFILGPDVELVECVEHAEDCWGRIFSIRVVIGGLRLKLTNVYAPHEGYAESTKQKFYSNMKKCQNEMNKFQTGQKILMGDFNAVIGNLDIDDFDEVVGQNNLLAQYTSDNGAYLLDFANQYKFQLLNTFFTHKRRHEGTHFNVKSRKWRRIDYIGSSKKFRCKIVKSCRAYTGMSLKAGKAARGDGGYTDHNLLVMELRVPGKKRCKKLLKGKIQTRSVKYDISRLQNDEFKQVFSDKVGELLKKDGTTIDGINENIMSAYLSAMEKMLPKVVKSGSGVQEILIMG